MFGAAAEIFQDKFVPFVPKVLGTLAKLIREEATSRLHTTVAETVGALVLNIIPSL